MVYIQCWTVNCEDTVLQSPQNFTHVCMETDILPATIRTPVKFPEFSETQLRKLKRYGYSLTCCKVLFPAVTMDSRYLPCFKYQ